MTGPPVNTVSAIARSRRHRRSCSRRRLPRPSRLRARASLHRVRRSPMRRPSRSQPCSGTWPMAVLRARILVYDVLLSGVTSTVGLSEDPFYLVDTDPIKLGDLRPRHPIARQGANAPELRGRYRAGVAPNPPLPSYRLRLGRRFALCSAHRHHRRNSKDARLAPGLMLGGRDRVLSGGCRVSRFGLRPRLEQVFRVSARSVDLFTISMSV